MGFQGLKFKRPRSGSSAAPFWNPEARLALPCQKQKNRNTDVKNNWFHTCIYVMVRTKVKFINLVRLDGWVKFLRKVLNWNRQRL